VAASPSKSTSPGVSVPVQSVAISERQYRAALEDRIQAEKARSAPSLVLGKSKLWVRRKSMVSVTEEETGI
jgi:tRNA(Ile2) C34 agmatinyltransferase TiaS